VTRLVLGVIGHVDHGKTTLVRALTGQDTDRLVQEKQRGISIALGFANLTIGSDTHIDLIDMPGHERFVRTMIGGATGIDAVLLVVAANEGIKPQTIEHVDIASLLGLRRAVVAITKTDLVASEQVQRVAQETVRLLAQSGLDPLPPAKTSLPSEHGIEDLREALKVLAAGQSPRSADGLAFLPIDRAFSIAGHGPVVTGTLRGTAVTTGDTLELSPLRRLVRVRAVQVHGSRVDAAAPGQRVALNLRDVDIAELKRSMALATPDSLQLSNWLTISIRAVDGAPPLKNGIRLRTLLGTGEYDSRLRLLDREVLEAGQSGLAQLHFAEQIALPAGEHVLLRLPSPPRTVAGGKVLDPGAQRVRRHCSAVLEHLEDLRVLPPAAMIAAEVRRQGVSGTTLQRLSQLSALATPRVIELLHPLSIVVTRSGLVVQQAHVDAVISRIPSLLAPHATGLSRDKLVSALGITAVVLDEALGRLRARGVIRERSGLFCLPRPDEESARDRQEAALAGHIAETLRQAGLTPPNPGAIVTDSKSKRAVERLLRAGVVVRAVDRAKGREILFHRDAIDDAQRRLAPLLDRVPGMLVTEIGAALGISRRYNMPLLDHLDTIGFTRRIKDRRIRADPARAKWVARDYLG
jgi:selenocysteine-specific elongation factor